MAKFCTNCGTQLNDDANFCTSCGTSQNGGVNPYNTNYNSNYSSAQPIDNGDFDKNLYVVAEVFCIISCISVAFSIIPLFWMIPMTVHLFNRKKTNQPLSTGFKVCVLLFVNLIAGIVLLCDDKA